LYFRGGSRLCAANASGVDKKPSSFLHSIAPGILVAATGVGAGDLINASLAGSDLGLVILWAAWMGALLKWLLNEGIARWQLATGTTVMEGWKSQLGVAVCWLFLVYLILWTLFVAGTIMKACGVAGHALTGVGTTFMWGTIHSVAGIALVLLGGFAVFEKAMSTCIGVMFVTVTLSAFKVGVALDSHFWSGLLIPRIPHGGLSWTLGVLGGVGGTVTLLSYGYWIADQERQGRAGLKACWLDLGIGYLMTAIFGISMLVIGSKLELNGKGSGVALDISRLLSESLSPIVGTVFLVGFWAAVFSSLLGVWQGVPYLFADFRRTLRGDSSADVDLEKTSDYRGYLLFLGLSPLALQWLSLKKIALVYAVLGSLFMPFLAGTLLYMNWFCLKENKTFRNPWWINLGLIATLVFFSYQGYSEFS
jgi:Mn2+/Fe2+ NRAMP family transporter